MKAPIDFFIAHLTAQNRILHTAKEKVTPEQSHQKSEKRDTADEIATLLDEMLGDTSRITDLRDAAILALILGSVLQASEVCALNISQLDEIRNGILFCVRKGGDWKEVGSTSFAVPYLERYLLTRESVDLTDPLFVSQKGNRLNRQALWESFHAKQSRRASNLRSTFFVTHSCQLLITTAVLRLRVISRVIPAFRLRLSICTSTSKNERML